VIQLTNWKALATAEANAQNVQADIVLATIEAETGGANILGDSGNAYGYGQVWPKWHRASFDYAGSILNIDVPVNSERLKALVLGNDRFSMIVAVNVIKKIWNNSGKDWVTFTKAYVGPAIPQSDLLRRQRIWEKYNSNAVYSEPGSDYNTWADDYGLKIPATNLQVVSNSQQNGNLMYGRKYRILVTDKKGKALDVSQLRCQFNIIKTIMFQPNMSEVTIYNLSPQTENCIIREGNRITIEAGYEGDNYGLIYDGDIVQTIRGKDDGVDYKLTIISLDGDRYLAYGMVNFTLVKGLSAREIITQLASKATIPTKINTISKDLSEARLTRGKVVFGLSGDYIRQISKGQNANFYVDDGKVEIVKATDIPEGQAIKLSSESGLIGVPEQTEYGMSATSYLNPKIKLNSMVFVDNSLIRERKIEFGQLQRSLDADGLYKVIKLEIIGDTRGNEWFTKMETITQAGYLPSMLANANTSQN
jgi:hypothetical protein